MRRLPEGQALERRPRMLRTQDPAVAAAGANPKWVSFSEQVPAAQTITLKQQLQEFGQDGVFTQKEGKPLTLVERDVDQTAVVFHPKAAQVVLRHSAKKNYKELQAMMEMQKGTHGVKQVSLRNLDPKIFRDHLTISNAITKRAGLPPPSRPFKRRSEAQAAKSNKELDEELRSKRTLLEGLAGGELFRLAFGPPTGLATY